MATVNVEFKAKTVRLEALEKKLIALNPEFIGMDNQEDTYFNVATGRLKLREGNIENSLIYYERNNTKGAKQSDILLYPHKPDAALKEILIKTHGIKAVVTKKRKIYFIENIKFHFDTVEGLGTFVEVEAIDNTGEIAIEKLKMQCSYYALLFEIESTDYIAESYSDMILMKTD
jgi:predicted adenylyl cyclase CyaB